MFTYDIQLTTEVLIRSRPHRVSIRQKQITRREIDNVHRRHLVMSGESDYASPMS